MAGRLTMESLESRTLMSASLDTFQLAGAGSSSAGCLSSDPQGNLYAAGTAKDAAGVNHVIVRKLTFGASDWQTILDIDHVAQSTSLPIVYSIAADAAGDVFIAGEAINPPTPSMSPYSNYVLKLATGASSAILIDQQTYAQYNAVDGAWVTTDSSGNLLWAGPTQTSSTKGNRTDISTYWTVRKWSPATSAWTTLDRWNGGATASSTLQDAYDFRSPHAISIIPGGTAAGIYVVGSNHVVNGGRDAWTVRRSTNGGATWTTVDTWTPDSTFQGPSASAYDVAGDAVGNVYVVGRANSTVITGYNKNKTPIYGSGPKHWVVRKSLGGNAGTWTTDADVVMSQYALISPKSLVVDSAGQVYAGGSYSGEIRTNIGGSWSTFTVLPGPTSGLLMTSSGTLYSSGSQGSPPVWTVQTVSTDRMTPSVAAAAPAQAMLASATTKLSRSAAGASPTVRATRAHRMLAIYGGKSQSGLLRPLVNS